MDHGFITFPTYDVEAEKPVVQLYGKLENGETFLAEIDYEPHFFIRKSDLEKAKSLTGVDFDEVKLANMEGDAVVRVNIGVPKDLPPLRRLLEDAGIPCYEADIRFPYRYMIDKRITGDVALRGEYEKGVRVDRVYKNPDVLPGNWQGELVVLSMDIETSKDQDLWSVCLATKDRQERLIINKDVEGAKNCADEKELLLALNDLVREIDPDVITGWNFIDFDLKVLKEKYEQHSVPWDWARATRKSSLRLSQEYFRDSYATIPGRMVLDGIRLLRMSFIKLDSYTLESVAQHYLGRGKLFKGKGRYQQIVDAYEKDPKKLLDYNMQDAILVLEILDETGALKLTIERSRITGMQLDRVSASIASLDMLYLPRLRERGCVAPSTGFTEAGEQLTGGYVLDSQPGIYDYVIVCDFKSLYPSVIRTLNIDPWSHKPGKKIPASTKEYIRAENGIAFKRETGILPGILTELWDQRDAARKKGDELARFAIKTLMNSFWGALASQNSRYFSLEIGNAITHSCQHIIKTAAERIREQGYSVIYGDTDSLFVDLNVESAEEAKKAGTKIEKDINTFFDEYMQERYNVHSYLELEFEKTFIRFFMPRTRGGEGSKKRYAGLLLKDGKEEIEFTGLEFVRRDWTNLSKEFQKGVLDKVFRREDPQPFIKKFVEELKAGKKDDLLVYRKALRKKVDEYVKTTPPHVKAARLLNEIKSNLIEYVMTVDGPEPIQKITHSLDYEHYVDKQLEPIANAILQFYDTTFEDVLRGTSQKGLFEF